MEKLVCKKCGVEKGTQEFSRHSSTSTGYQTYCRECMKPYQRGYRLNHKDKCNAQVRKYRLSNPLSHKTRCRDYQTKNRAQLSDNYIKNQLKALGFEKEDITPSLIELKRQHLSLLRNIKIAKK